MGRTYENTAFKRRRNKERLEDLQQQIDLLKAKIDEILRPVIGDDKWFSHHYVCPAGWNCEKSPVGWCVYNDDVDRIHDNCIYCGQAHERK